MNRFSSRPFVPTQSDFTASGCAHLKAFKRNIAVILLSANLLTPKAAFAADFTLKPGGGSWYDASTWIGGIVPGLSVTDVVRVNSVGGQTIQLFVDDDPSALAFDPWTIDTLHVAAPASTSLGLGTVKLLPPDLNDPSTISLPRVLSLKAVNAAAGSILVFEDQLQVMANGLVINGDGSQGRVELAGSFIDFQDSLDPTNDVAGSIEVKGGTVVFKASTSYTGATTLNGGKIVLEDNVSFSVSEGLTLRSGTLTADASDREVSDIVSVRGPVQLGELGSGALTLKGPVDLAGDRRVLTVVGDVVISGSLTNGGTSTGTLVKAGPGTLELKGQSTYTGGTELLEGRLIASVENALGGSTGANNALLPGGTLTVGGGVLELGANQNVTGIRIGGGSVVASTGATPSLVVHGSEIVADVQSRARVEVALTERSGTTVALNKTGSGVLELTGSNLYSGNTTIKEGEIRVFAGAQNGVDGSPLGKVTGGGEVRLDGGSLRVSGGNAVVDLKKNVTVVSSGALVAEGGGVKLERLLVNSNATFRSSGLVTASSLDLDGRIVLDVVGGVLTAGAVTNGGTSSGTLVKAGPGSLEIRGQSTYTGGTELLEGRLIASVENALGGSTGANNAPLPGGTLTVGGGVLELGANQNVTGIRISGGSVVASTGATPSLVVQGSEIVADVQSRARVEVALTESSGSTVTLNKTGPGVLELTGSNLYSGNTTIKGGEIRVFAGAQNGVDGSPLGKVSGSGEVRLDGGSLRVSGGNAVVDLKKNVTVVSSGALIAEGGGVKLERLLVNSNATFRSSGLVTASSIDLDGRIVLSGNNPISAGSLKAGPGAVFVWDKPNIGQSNVGVRLTTNAETDLSKAKVEFSKEYLERALIETKALMTAGGASAGQNTFQVGSLAVSSGTLRAPTVVQSGGEMSFSLDTSDPTKIGIVLERSAYEQLTTGINGVANMFNYVPLQTLAVVNTLDMHLDDLNAGGAASSYVSMGVKVNVTPTETSPLSPVAGGSESQDRSMRVWTSGYGSWASIDADPATYQGKVTSAGGGGVLGLERSFGSLSAGLLVSVGQAVSRADAPQMRVESENWNLGGYSTVQIGPVSVDVSALWGISEQDSKREVPTGDIATARYSARNWQTGLGVALNLASPESTWQLAPVARVKFLNTSQDAFEETGSALGIGSNARNQSHWLTKLGLRASKSMSLTQSIAMSLDGAAYWVHDYNSEGREMQFQLGGAPYVVRSRDRKADSTQFNLGLQATFSDAVTLRLSGQQDVAEDRSQTSGVFSLAYKF